MKINIMVKVFNLAQNSDTKVSLAIINITEMEDISIKMAIFMKVNLFKVKKMVTEQSNIKMGEFMKDHMLKVKEKVTEHSNGKMAKFMKDHLKTIYNTVSVCALQKTRKLNMVNGKTAHSFDILKIKIN